MTLANLAPVALDLRWRQGDDVTIRFPWQNPDGTPVNLTGRTFTAVVADRAEAPVAATVTQGRISPDPGFNSVVIFALTAAQTATLPGPMSWSLSETTSGKVTLLAGTVTVDHPVVP